MNEKKSIQTAVLMFLIVILTVSFFVGFPLLANENNRETSALDKYGDLLQYEWPQIHGDSGFTRFSEGPAPESSEILWKASIKGIQSYVTAFNGKECLDKLKKVKPDLILLDMMIPSMSGREVCKRIRENPKTKNLKIAFLTVARFSETGKDILKKMNVLDYITKPFDNEDLIRRVKKII